MVALDVATGKMKWHFQYTPNDSWDFDEAGVFMLYDQKIQGIDRKVVGHFARNGFFYSVDRTNGRFIKAEKYVNDLNWTKGIHPESGKPLDYNPKLDVQIYNPEARALRGDGQKRSCPTWHGGVAHQPLAYNPVKGIAYGVGTEGCFTQNGAAVASLGKDGGIDNKTSERRQFSSDLYYGAVTAFDTVNHKVVAKAVTDIEIRSGATVTAGGLVFTALQDGWVVAYNDETLEELWRFNVGTPLKGAPVTYADRAEAVSRGAGQRPPPAPGELGQAAELQLPVRVRAELVPAMRLLPSVASAWSVAGWILDRGSRSSLPRCRRSLDERCRTACSPTPRPRAARPSMRSSARPVMATRPQGCRRRRSSATPSAATGGRSRCPRSPARSATRCPPMRQGTLSPAQSSDVSPTS